MLSARPGMASLAFIKYRHEEELLAAAGDDLEHAHLTQVLPDKLRMDLDYIEQQSFPSPSLPVSTTPPLHSPH